MNIAIEGCLHGQLSQVYQHLLQLQKQTSIKIDLLIICGDFQAIRDANDLDHMHCPPKYKEMGSFNDYFSGKKLPPFVTVFIGGNHEAVNYMRDLHFGGWVAPRIYYLGQVGSIIVKCKRNNSKIRISGMSGIYNHRDFQYILKTERIPLYGKDRISAYHLKQIDVFRMELLARLFVMKKQDPEKYGEPQQNFDIFLSHDWPKDIAFYGNIDELYKYKSFLRKEIEQGMFGSPPLTRILKIAKPSYFFSAHMHIKYAAIFPHLNDEYTHFLALDKCLQNRSCLQILNFHKQIQVKDQQSEEKNSGSQKIQKPKQETKKTYDYADDIDISYDQTWLAVLKLTSGLQNQNRTLYKYDNKQNNYQNLKINDSKLMNEYIEKYGQLRKQLHQFTEEQLLCRPYKRVQIIKRDTPEEQQIVNNQFQEIDQTINLLEKLLKLDLNTFAGTIIPMQKIKARQEQKMIEQKEENSQGKHADNDQIEIDL